MLFQIIDWCYLSTTLFFFPLYEAHTTTVVKLLFSVNLSSTFLCGDYNLLNVKWTNSTSSLGFTTTGILFTVSSQLIDSFSFPNFFQPNLVNNSYENLLDLVFSTSVKSSIVLAPSSLVCPDSFHPSLYINLTCS